LDTHILEGPHLTSKADWIPTELNTQKEIIDWLCDNNTNSKVGLTIWIIEDSTIFFCPVKKVKGQWSYKKIPEGEELISYSCPLNFFDIAEERDPNWRDIVREYHRRIKMVNDVRPERDKYLKEKFILTLESLNPKRKLNIPYVVTERINRPIIGRYKDKLYNVPEKWIKSIEREEQNAVPSRKT